MRKLSAAFITIFLVLGCTLQSHQITLSPQAIAPPGSFGNGQKIQLLVEDARASKIIGKRTGSDRKTDTIEATNNISDALRNETALVLRKMGFEVWFAKSAPIQVKIIVEELSYTSPDQNLVTHVDLKSVLRVEAKKAKTTYKSRYVTTSKLGVAYAPSRDINEVEINKVLSSTLSRLIGDTKLIGHLAR